MELGDLDAGVDAQCGIEVGQRLVEQEDLRLAHDGTADRDALALAAREFARAALQQRLELQDARGLGDARLDLGLGRSGEPEAEAHVGGNVHVGVERVGLEHHGDLALRGREIVHLAAADGDGAARYGLQPGDGAQQGGLAAARGADEDDEGAVLDGEVDVLQDLDGAEGLLQVLDQDFGHGRLT